MWRGVGVDEGVGLGDGVETQLAEEVELAVLYPEGGAELAGLDTLCG